MSENQYPYQPGVIFYDVILGLIRARGMSFEGWCAENSITPSAMRNAVFGQSGGARGQELRSRIIESAGSDLVRQAYTQRIKHHAETFDGTVFKQGAA